RPAASIDATFGSLECPDDVRALTIAAFALGEHDVVVDTTWVERQLDRSISSDPREGNIESKTDALREDDRALDHVLQLADVTRPVVSPEPIDILGRQRRGRHPMLLRHPRNAVRGQLGNVVLSRPQRWQRERKDVQPIEQILAEPAGAD